MLIKKYPNGKALLGVASDDYLTNNTYNDPTPIGTVQMFKSDSSATSTAHILVTVPTGSTYSSQLIAAPDGFKDKGDTFTIKCEVYTDNITVKFRLMSQTRDSVSYILAGYIYPAGSNADLNGFEKVATINIKDEFKSGGGFLLNIINSTTGNRITGFYINTGFTINTDYNPGYQLTSSKDVLVELDTVSSDLINTISDLSSESAAKFVSR